jgi:predicted metalloprotease with PDZ domain
VSSAGQAGSPTPARGETLAEARFGLCLLLLLGWASAAAAQPIAYSLRYDTGSPGVLEVEIHPGDLPLPQTLTIPRAIPMGYGEQPFDRFVVGLEAFGPGRAPIPLSRAAGPRWRIGDAPGTLRSLRYRVDLGRLESEVRMASDASKARDGYVGVLGYSVLAFLEGHEGRRIRLDIEAPDDWPAFLTLAPAAPPNVGAAAAEADDYYALADSQILLGPDLEVRRVGGEPPLFVASYAESELDAARVARAGREALDALVAYFRSVPFPHYTIVVEVLRPVSPGHEYGFSMEHLDSGTFFLDARGALTANSTEQELRRGRYNYAHHIAHAWIPKRCYGPGYFPFSWAEAPVLDTIWFSEGFVQYAAAVALAEQMGAEGGAWLESLIGFRFRETLAETPDFIREMDTVALSRLASTRYSEDFRTGANSFSRGGMMAREMDERIRAETDGRRSLADALRHVIAWSARERRPFELEQIPRLLSEGAGVELRDIYESWMAAPGSP